MTDKTAIATKARENIIFAMSQINEHERIAMSYTKEEFIKECSFNNRECSVERYVAFANQNAQK
jgi:hypothetical protein